MNSELFNTAIHLDFEFYCLLNQNFIYITHVIDDIVTLDIGVIYFIENEDLLWNKGFFKFNQDSYTSVVPLENISIGSCNVYYKPFDRLSILDGSSCRAVIEAIKNEIV